MKYCKINPKYFTKITFNKEMRQCLTAKVTFVVFCYIISKNSTLLRKEFCGTQKFITVYSLSYNTAKTFSCPSFGDGLIGGHKVNARLTPS